MLGHDGRVTAIVFVHDGRMVVTASDDGTLIGTPSYMAPEQALFGKAPVGASPDVHSLGAILYFGLTGRSPFRGENDLETLDQVRTTATRQKHVARLKVAMHDPMVVRMHHRFR